MSEYLKKALESADSIEKVAFGESTIGRAFVKALDKNPYITLGAIGGGAGILGSASAKAFDVASNPVSTQSYLADKKLNPGLGGALTRVRADELFAKGLATNTTEIVNSFINEAVAKSMKSYKKLMYAPKQKATLQNLIETDDMIREADPDHLASLFKTMTEVAPKMTSHKEAVRSFLRQGLAHEGGLDPVTIGE